VSERAASGIVTCYHTIDAEKDRCMEHMFGMYPKPEFHLSRQRLHAIFPSSRNLAGFIHKRLLTAPTSNQPPGPDNNIVHVHSSDKPEKAPSSTSYLGRNFACPAAGPFTSVRVSHRHHHPLPDLCYTCTVLASPLLTRASNFRQVLFRPQ